MRDTKSTSLGRVRYFSVSHGALAVWMLLVAVPFVWMVVTSFKTDREIFTSPWSLPDNWQFDNFARAWTEAGIGRFFLNSFLTVIPSVTMTLTVSAMAAYALAVLEFRGRRAIYYLIVAGLTFPVFMALVPLFFIAKDLDLLNTYHGLAIIYTAFSVSFTVLFLTSFFGQVPSEMREAAVIDGASERQVFIYVMVPLIKPGLITMGIFNFIGQWNQYILPLVLVSDDDRYVLPQGLRFLTAQQEFRSDWSALFAAMTIIMIPTLIVYLLFQRRIEAGLTAGALRG